MLLLLSKLLEVMEVLLCKLASHGGQDVGAVDWPVASVRLGYFIRTLHHGQKLPHNYDMTNVVSRVNRN